MFNVTGLASSLLSWSSSTDNRSSYSTGTYVALAAITIAVIGLGIRILKQVVSSDSHGNGTSHSLGGRRVSVSGPVDTKHVDSKQKWVDLERAGFDLFCKLTSTPRQELEPLSSSGFDRCRSSNARVKLNSPWFVALRVKERDVLVVGDGHHREPWLTFKKRLVDAAVKKKACLFLEGIPRSPQEKTHYSTRYNVEQPGYLFGLEGNWDLHMLQQCHIELANIATSDLRNDDNLRQAFIQNFIGITHGLLRSQKGYKAVCVQNDKLPIVQKLMGHVVREGGSDKGVVSFYRQLPKTMKTITEFQDFFRGVGGKLVDSVEGLEEGHKKLIRQSFMKNATLQDFDAASAEITLKLRNQIWAGVIKKSLPKLSEGVPVVLMVGYEHLDGLVPMLGELSN